SQRPQGGLPDVAAPLGATRRNRPPRGGLPDTSASGRGASFRFGGAGTIAVSFGLLAIAQAALERHLALRLGGRRRLVLRVFRLVVGEARLARVGQQRERDLPHVRLDLEDADLDLLARLGEVGDSAYPRRRQLRDVDEALDARLELDEGTEFHG